MGIEGAVLATGFAVKLGITGFVGSVFDQILTVAVRTSMANGLLNHRGLLVGSDQKGIMGRIYHISLTDQPLPKHLALSS